MLQATVETKLKVTQPQQSEVPPTVAPMEPIIVNEGKSARFNTVVQGKPKPKVQWYREGSLIPSSKDFMVSTCLLNFSEQHTLGGLTVDVMRGFCFLVD